MNKATGYIDPRTTLSLGESCPDLPLPDIDELNTSLQSAIISSSGWRFIAAPGGEEDASERLSAKSAGLAWVMAAGISRYFANQNQSSTPQTVLVACDSRPTGPAIASIVIRALAAKSIRIRYAFIAASPEVMAYAALEPELSGFIYISASHNPVGYNGFKIGGPGGGVFGGSAAAQLSEQLYTLAKSPEDLAACHAEFTAVSEREIASVLQSAEVWKEAALQAYHSWTDLIAFDRDDDIAASLSESIRMSPIGIVHDMNGSARCNSIDDKYLGSIGLQVHALHPGLRNFSHAIVPEGDSLLPCCHELAHVHAGNPQFLFGYVPDNDGDRGNLVVFDSNLFRARPVVAQEVFAIGVVAELSWLLYSGQLHMDPNGRLQERAAVVVNGPTSLRVDAICKLFDVEVYRAEVGEANVVELAEILRSKGYMVRILGEGSNGGTILHPARIRDPLNTLVSLVKFLRLPPNQAGLTPWKIWASRCGSETATADLAALLRSLPQYITTGAYEERAVLRGTTKDHAALKAAYEDLFLEYWQQRKNYLHDRFGFYTYKFFNTEGAEQRAGMGREYRSGDQSGGLTVLFKDDTGNPRGFFWMRGSKTEPVFRIMVDIDSNDPQDESDLFEDHRRLVEQANDKVIKLAET